MASALINVPAKAKRGDIIEIKTLMSHIMETGYRHMASGEVVPRDIITSFTCRFNGNGDFPRRPVSGDLRQPLHHLLHHRDRERQVRVRMDRRPGVFRNRVRFDHGRMRFAGAIAVALLIAGAAFAAEIPQAERRSGYDFMKPDTKAMQDEDTANPGMLWVLDGEGLWKRKAGAANKACADCHGDARTSMKGVAARYPAFDKATRPPGRSGAAHQFVPHQPAAGDAAAFREPRAAGAHRLCRATVARRSDRNRQPTRNSRRSSKRGASSTCSGRASSISAAPIAMTIIGTSGSPAPRSRKDTRPATRSTGWNGNRWVRCSGACAPASPASGRRPMITARRNWSNWNCT